MRTGTMFTGRLLLSGALFLAALLATGHGQAAEVLTLEQAVAAALKHNEELTAANAQVDAAQAGLSEARAAFLPKVTLSESYVRSDNPLMVLGAKLNQEIVTPADFAPDVLNGPDPMTNYTTRVEAVQPLFNGGRSALGVKQARLGLDAADQRRERVRQETVFSVIKAYYGVLLARESHAVATRSLETSEANVRLADARYRAGAVLQSDLLRAKVQLAEVQEMVTRTRNGITLANANLAFAMGVPQTTEFEAQEMLVPHRIEGELESRLEQALNERPDLAAVGLQRRQAETGVTQARTAYLPSLNVIGQADWNSADFAGDDAKSWAVMAVFQWNLFDGLATRARVRSALASSEQMRALEARTRSAVQLQVRQAFYTVLASLDRIAATSSSVQEAEEGLRIVQKRYEAGMTTFVDVLGAETALIRARTGALQALYDNNVSYAELRLAVGSL